MIIVEPFVAARAIMARVFQVTLLRQSPNEQTIITIDPKDYCTFGRINILALRGSDGIYKATRDQFEVHTDDVVHKPTRAIFIAEAGQTQITQLLWGHAGNFCEMMSSTIEAKSRN